MGKCKDCGAEEKENGFTNSLHAWQVEFECGSIISGAIGEVVGIETNECKNK